MKLKPLVAFVASIIALGTIFSTTTRAYTVLGYIWPPSAVPVPYYINPANMDLPTSAIEPAIRIGADAWRLQSGASFGFAFAGFSTQTTNTNDGINLVMFRNASSGSALATTYSWFSGTRIIDADIVFWDAGFQFVTGTSGCSGAFFIEDIATHEFGHALGLGHSTVATATMYPSISTCSQQSRTLDPDDIAAVLSLYPSTATPPTPPTGLRVIK
jgi:Matrixin